MIIAFDSSKPQKDYSLISGSEKVVIMVYLDSPYTSSKDASGNPLYSKNVIDSIPKEFIINAIYVPNQDPSLTDTLEEDYRLITEGLAAAGLPEGTRVWVDWEYNPSYSNQIARHKALADAHPELHIGGYFSRSHLDEVLKVVSPTDVWQAWWTVALPMLNINLNNLPLAPSINTAGVQYMHDVYFNETFVDVSYFESEDTVAPIPILTPAPVEQTQPTPVTQPEGINYRMKELSVTYPLAYDYQAEVLQKLLSIQYPSLAVDGIYGPITAGFVKAYEAKEGLTVDAGEGIAGPQVWGKLLGL
jgi:hypothetical protein